MMQLQDTVVLQWRELVEAGNAAYEARRYSEAEIKFQDALKMVEAWLPKDEKKSPEADVNACLAKSLNNLAALYHSQGKYAMAEELYERCLDLKLSMYGEEHLEVAVNLHNLAALHSARRKYGKAEILYKRALEIREKLLGEKHPELVSILRNYSLMLKKQNREEEARQIDERADAIAASA